MNGIFLYSGYNNIFNSTSRSMARFGLLILNNHWDGNQIMSDKPYFSNGKILRLLLVVKWQIKLYASGSQFVFNGDITPNAPF